MTHVGPRISAAFRALVEENVKKNVLNVGNSEFVQKVSFRDMLQLEHTLNLTQALEKFKEFASFCVRFGIRHRERRRL